MTSLRIKGIRISKVQPKVYQSFTSSDRLAEMDSTKTGRFNPFNGLKGLFGLMKDFVIVGGDFV